MSKEKAELIRQVAAEMNFEPSVAARQLKGKLGESLGMIAANWNAFHARVFAWIQHHSAARGYQVLSACCNMANVDHAVANILRRQVDGTLVCAQGWVNQRYVEEVLARLPRVVSIFGRLDIPGCPCVRIDEADGIRQALEHLHARGRRRICLVQGDESSESQCIRQEAFIKEHRRLAGEPDPRQLFINPQEWSYDEPDVLQRVEEAVERLVVRDRADALITYDDFSAAHLMRGLARRGLKVPDDVALVGFENDLISSHVNPLLSTVAFPVGEVTETAVKMLIQTARDDDSQLLRSQTLKPRLIVRETS